MNLDKALYMSEFLKIREDLGTTEIYSFTNTLYSNLYDDFKPKEEIKEVTEILEEMGDTIKEKTIHLLKKEDQHVFFPDLPELIEEEKIEEEKEKLEDIKVIQVTKDDPVMNGGTSELKTISLNPQYVSKD
mgnify:CR=1 FL=1|tara:strand:- start:1226 stop:1618 length:393 start_codon:yes stop_codon:yes gene_type:complete